VVMGIGDDPVAADEFCGAAAKIGDGDGVGKHKTVARLVGLLRQVIYLRLNDEVMLVALFHLRHLNRFLSASQDANVEMYRHQTEILLLASIASATGR